MAKTIDYFNGIVELAKAGYKPSDVKELLELCKTNPPIESDSANDLNTQNTSDVNKSAAANDNDIDAIAAIIERNNKGD
mgnify:CR=1 FL=1